MGPQCRKILVPLIVVATLAVPPALAADTVATVLGQAISRSEIAADGEQAEVTRLHDLLWRRVSRHYIEHHGLAATEAELAEASAYHREYERKDRAQRARKLAEIDHRLAGGALKAGERAWLEEFHAVLKRLARRDAENDALTPPDARRQAGLLQPGVERWKMNRALYEQYGGVVALTRFGPDPHGARAALVADYEARGLLRVSDAALRERLFARLALRPSMVVPPAQVDFTPYWKRPIPPSYFPN